MQFLILVSLVAIVACETYDTNNDNLDIEAIVSDASKLKNYIDCFLDKGACDAVQSDFKKDVPEAVQQSCAKCSDAQKHIFRRTLEGLKEKLPQEYEDFKKKYDPDNKYFANLESVLSKA